MVDKQYKLRIDQDTEEAYESLRQWCKRNRVPIGRILNTTIRALQGLVDYDQVGAPKHCVIDIKYPKQTNVEDHLRYRKRRNLTRVK